MNKRSLRRVRRSATSIRLSTTAHAAHHMLALAHIEYSDNESMIALAHIEYNDKGGGMLANDNIWCVGDSVLGVIIKNQLTIPIIQCV